MDQIPALRRELGPTTFSFRLGRSHRLTWGTGWAER